MDPYFAPSATPELIFGLVAPIGVDLDLVSEVLSATLREMRYEATEFRLTTLMAEVPVDKPLTHNRHIDSYLQRITYANAVRAKLGDDAMAALAISAIRSFRLSERTEKPDVDNDRLPLTKSGETNSVEERPEERPLNGHAFILRQLKRPDEIALLRSVYGRQFIQISAYSPESHRLKYLKENERRNSGGTLPEHEAFSKAQSIVRIDSKESGDRHGQNVLDAFPLADVFIDATSKEKCEYTLRRFIRLLFGSNEITPTHDEYGMYMAKSASLRSSDLSRQIGAAIFRNSGEVATLGSNEVPKFGGGTYWTSDNSDKRDFVQGFDPNEIRKKEVLVDMIDRLRKSNRLSPELQAIGDNNMIVQNLLEDDTPDGIKSSKLMDIIEFGRIIHAEMSAITDAARKGISIEGSTLYSTTFPCHLCAKHIVSSGIVRTVYIEPYPKSYALDLHGDAISVDDEDQSGKVRFQSFIGVSPFRYRDLFEKGKRKYSGGVAQKWHRGQIRPMIDVYFPSYIKAETIVVAKLKSRLQDSEINQ